MEERGGELYAGVSDDEIWEISVVSIGHQLPGVGAVLNKQRRERHELRQSRIRGS